MLHVTRLKARAPLQVGCAQASTKEGCKLLYPLLHMYRAVTHNAFGSSFAFDLAALLARLHNKRTAAQKEERG